MHSGSAPAGIASATYKTGRYSRAMPVSLKRSYEAARSDPDLLSLVDEVALVQARLRELIERVRDGGAAKRQPEFEATWAALKSATRRRDPVALAAAIERHGALIEDMGRDDTLWTEIRETLRLAAILMNQEARRRVEMGDYVRTSVTLELFMELLRVVRAQVQDPVALRAIQQSMKQIIDGNPRIGSVG